MERLTENKLGQSYPLKDKASSKVSLFTDYDGFYAYFEAINRLGCIEDVLGDEYDLDRLRELMKIGRCKDCIHYCQSECLKIYDDGACSEYARQERKPDDFCSYFKSIASPEH